MTRRLLANMQSAVWRLEYLKAHPDEAERTPWPELLKLAAWDIAASVLGVVPIWRGLDGG